MLRFLRIGETSVRRGIHPDNPQLRPPLVKFDFQALQRLLTISVEIVRIAFPFSKIKKLFHQLHARRPPHIPHAAPPGNQDRGDAVRHPEVALLSTGKVIRMAMGVIKPVESRHDQLPGEFFRLRPMFPNLAGEPIRNIPAIHHVDGGIQNVQRIDFSGIFKQPFYSFVFIFKSCKVFRIFFKQLYFSECLIIAITS